MDLETPETLGEYLKNSRESIGLSVEEVSFVTKIRAQYIEAIESGDFTIFSSQHLLKGYVKLISKTVKADSKKTAELLEIETTENFKNKHIEDIVGKRFKEEIKKSEDLKKKILTIVLGVIILLILSYGIIKVIEYIKTAPKIHITLPFQSSIKSLVSERRLSLNNKPLKIKKIINSPNAETNYAEILKGKVIKRTWVAVKIDGGSTVTSMLYSGDTEVWKAQKRIKIKIGNAGGIVLNYNGKDIGEPGAEKQVVTLNFPSKHKTKTH